MKLKSIATLLLSIHKLGALGFAYSILSLSCICTDMIKPYRCSSWCNVVLIVPCLRSGSSFRKVEYDILGGFGFDLSVYSFTVASIRT